MKNLIGGQLFLEYLTGLALWLKKKKLHHVYFFSVIVECNHVNGLIWFIVLIFHRRYDVARPQHIELPRSLVEVVVHWNIPMHLFLKNCEYVDCLRSEKINNGPQLCLEVTPDHLIKNVKSSLVVYLRG